MKTAVKWESRASQPSDRRKPRWVRRTGAIFGMILMIILAIALVQQESGRLVRRTHDGRFYSPFLHEVARSFHHRSAMPQAAAHSASVPRSAVRDASAPAGESRNFSGHTAAPR
ncbi:MAG: hypothetical protein ACREP6_08990 [Candidatus Binataceae bacterium]